MNNKHNRAIVSKLQGWHKCTEDSYPENLSTVAIKVYMDGWFFWTYDNCPYGWNVLCRMDEAYWTNLCEDYKINIKNTNTMNNIHSIKEAIELWGAENKVVENGDATSLEKLPYSDILKNKEDAVEYLSGLDKSELVSYLLQGENAKVKIY